MAGFANGRGGVLVIGIGDRIDKGRRSTQPRLDPVQGNPHAVLAAVEEGLRTLHPHLPSSSRVQLVKARAGGFYLVVGTGRTPLLVPSVEVGLVLYYCRLQDSTVCWEHASTVKVERPR